MPRAKTLTVRPYHRRSWEPQLYQLKIITASTPNEVESQANVWLKKKSRNELFRLVEVTPTDVIQISSNSGMQRFTLVIAYETN